MKIDKVSIYKATDKAKSSIVGLRDLISRIDKDIDKAERVVLSLCKHCFYERSSRIGGARITKINCAICHDEMRFGSTAVDPICLPCALRNDLCKQCAGDINMKHIRSKRDFQI